MSLYLLSSALLGKQVAGQTCGVKTCAEIVNATTCYYDIMSTGNVFLNNEVEGAVWARGDIGTPFKISFDYRGFPPPDPDNFASVVAGGTITPEVPDNGLSVLIGYVRSGQPLPTISGQTTAAKNNNVGSDPTLTTEYFDGVEADLQCLFNQMCALPSTQTVRTAENLPNKPIYITFDAAAPLAVNATATVYNVTWDELFTPGLSEQPAIIGQNFSQTANVIINVTGAPADAIFPYGFVGDFTTEAYRRTTVWNFCDMNTSISSSQIIYGAWFTAGSDCAFTDVREGGTYLCENFSSINEREVHTPNWCPTNPDEFLTCTDEVITTTSTSTTTESTTTTSTTTESTTTTSTTTESTTTTSTTTESTSTTTSTTTESTTTTSTSTESTTTTSTTTESTSTTTSTTTESTTTTTSTTIESTTTTSTSTESTTTTSTTTESTTTTTTTTTTDSSTTTTTTTPECTSTTTPAMGKKELLKEIKKTIQQCKYDCLNGYIEEPLLKCQAELSVLLEQLAELDGDGMLDFEGILEDFDPASYINKFLSKFSKPVNLFSGIFSGESKKDDTNTCIAEIFDYLSSFVPKKLPDKIETIFGALGELKLGKSNLLSSKVEDIASSIDDFKYPLGKLHIDQYPGSMLEMLKIGEILKIQGHPVPQECHGEC